MKKYIRIALGSEKFNSAKTCVVGADGNSESLITDYVSAAKTRVCEGLGYSENDVDVLDWSFFGSEVHFFD